MFTHHQLPICLFFLATLIYAQCKESTYQTSKNDNRYMDTRSERDSERAIRRVFDANTIRFGRRSDLPPHPEKYPYQNRYGIPEDDMIRAQRVNNNHLRFGRAGSNFMRFRRSNNSFDGTSRYSRGNSNFLRFGRGNDDSFIRFGRPDNYMRFGRGSNFMRFGRDAPEERYKRDLSESKREPSNFMRFGRDYEDDLETPEEAEDYSIKNYLGDVPLATFLNEIACKMDNANCEKL